MQIDRAVCGLPCLIVILHCACFVLVVLGDCNSLAVVWLDVSFRVAKDLCCGLNVVNACS